MMKTPELLVPAARQYRHNNDREAGFVIGYDEEMTRQIVIDLQNTIIDLKACLRTCANAANGGLSQYS